MTNVRLVGILLALMIRIRGHMLWAATLAMLVATHAAARATVLITGAPVRGIPAIKRGFVGLSIEYPSLLAYTGVDPQHIDPVFEQLVRSLAPGGAPSLRIGGVSTDHAWWPAKGVKRSPGITFTLTAKWLAAVRAFADDVDARTLLGLNLEAEQPALAAAEARALIGGLGRARVAGFEVGNEPSNYPHFAWYRIHGRAVRGRPRSYGFPEFTRDFAGFARRLGGLPIAGPALAGYGWLAQLRAFLRAVPRISTVTFHRYPLNRCFPPPGSPEQATLPNLLAPFAAGGFLAPARPYVALAHARGATFRLDEFNSVSCSGKVGLSDTFASALWAADTLFEVANDGIDGVNVHTFPGAPYAPFDVSHTAGSWSAVVHPEYYGLLLFTRAAPPGGRLLTVTGSTPTGVRVWATRGPGRVLRIVIINKNGTAPYRAAIAVGVAAGAADVQRLRAAGLRSKAGVTLGGQSAATPSLTGALIGRPSTETVSPHGGRYVLTVPPASAALLTATVGVDVPPTARPTRVRKSPGAVNEHRRAADRALAGPS